VWRDMELSSSMASTCASTMARMGSVDGLGMGVGAARASGARIAVEFGIRTFSDVLSTSDTEPIVFVTRVEDGTLAVASQTDSMIRPFSTARFRRRRKMALALAACVASSSSSR